MAQKDAASRLCDRIRRARRIADVTQADVTQADLARRVGVQPSAVAQWEASKGTAPSVDNLIRLAMITRVSFEWLATGRGDALDNPTEPPAAEVTAFAQDIDEERLLEIFRRVPYAKRADVVKLLDSLLS